MKKSLFILSAVLSLSLISCTTTKKNYPVFENNTFVVTEIDLSTSLIPEGDERVPEFVEKLPLSTISEYVTMNTGYTLDFGLINDDVIKNYSTKKNIKTDKKFLKKVLNFFVDDKYSYVVSADYEVEPIVVEVEDTQLDPEYTLEAAENTEVTEEAVPETVAAEETPAVEEVTDVTTEEKAAEVEETVEAVAEITEAAEAAVEAETTETQEEVPAEPVINYIYPDKNVAKISFVQDYETGKLAVLITLKTVTYENKTTFKCNLATEIPDWSYTETYTTPDTAALVYFDKDIKLLSVNGEPFANYKRHNTAPSDGYYYVPTNEEMTFVCTIIDDGNVLFDAEELQNIQFTYTFNPNAKYRVTFKVGRNLVKTNRTVTFNVDEKNLLTEAIDEQSAEETTENNAEDEIQEDTPVFEISLESTENSDETTADVVPADTVETTETVEETPAENTETAE